MVREREGRCVEKCFIGWNKEAPLTAKAQSHGELQEALHSLEKQGDTEGRDLQSHRDVQLHDEQRHRETEGQKRRRRVSQTETQRGRK